MSDLPTKKENPDGLYNRYTISKKSGKAIDPRAEYFVLRLDEHGDDQKHIEACRIAIRAYAHAIDNHIPKLADDLLKRYCGYKERKVSKVIKPEEFKCPKCGGEVDLFPQGYACKQNCGFELET